MEISSEDPGERLDWLVEEGRGAVEFLASGCCMGSGLGDAGLRAEFRKFRVANRGKIRGGFARFADRSWPINFNATRPASARLSASA